MLTANTSLDSTRELAHQERLVGPRARGGDLLSGRSDRKMSVCSPPRFYAPTKTAEVRSSSAPPPIGQRSTIFCATTLGGRISLKAWPGGDSAIRRKTEEQTIGSTPFGAHETSPSHQSATASNAARSPGDLHAAPKRFISGVFVYLEGAYRQTTNRNSHFLRNLSDWLVAR
jgi:hypothetical protein